MKKASQISPTPVRVPHDLKRWLQHSAIENHRSLNSEILHRLEKSRIHEEAKEARQ
ncbi:Arc family DNA-binding protein [Thauera aromatica]|uniref:Arc family DNA-binding protein n=1 Tax=Thauera aromatica TaxID=59405 RepID=UPI00131D6CDB|nr:Arc family DNA-binding protein [Thauera aromatica]